jgi:hypothetical protein
MGWGWSPRVIKRGQVIFFFFFFFFAGTVPGYCPRVPGYTFYYPPTSLLCTFSVLPNPEHESWHPVVYCAMRCSACCNRSKSDFICNNIDQPLNLQIFSWHLERQRDTRLNSSGQAEMEACKARAERYVCSLVFAIGKILLQNPTSISTKSSIR